ncbi:MAG: hydrogenase iron-sulfur subunit [candidate division KSB1 bacterium]|nr:hydrogenase iron-sulfur subunit [candidate division KSB1 bacterium]MDZ7401501.1 hydrogenase iron-sulfur subunit [candidate division KSB1 bacterium]
MAQTKKSKSDPDFDPKIVAFCCNWCSYPAADGAGVNRIQYPPNVRIIRVMCGGRVNPSFVLKALELGADGVLVATCHFEDCHYMFGARRAAENYQKLERMLHLVGIEKGRVRLEWVSAAESPKFARVVNELINDVKKLGPSPLRKSAPSRMIEIPIETEEAAVA